MSDLEQDWLERVEGLKQWQRGDERAPHKPLLLLQVMGSLQRGESSRIAYDDYSPRMKELLLGFGPPRAATKPDLPFRHLVSDGLWQISDRQGIILSSAGGTVFKGSLTQAGAVGQLHEADEEALRQNPVLIRTTIRRLLDKNWPPSLHDDMCDTIGLIVDELIDSTDPDDVIEELTEPDERPDLKLVENTESGDDQDVADDLPRRKRDPQFRRKVLLAYGWKCAMCDWDGRDGGAGTVALEAAHVKWHAVGGPDATNNGLSLCSMHHKLLDRGLVGLTLDKRVLVSQYFQGDSAVAQAVISLSGMPVHEPHETEDTPRDDYIEWHNDQVFKSPEIPLSA